MTTTHWWLRPGLQVSTRSHNGSWREVFWHQLAVSNIYKPPLKAFVCHSSFLFPSTSFLPKANFPCLPASTFHWSYPGPEREPSSQGVVLPGQGDGLPRYSVCDKPQHTTLRQPTRPMWQQVEHACHDRLLLPGLLHIVVSY